MFHRKPAFFYNHLQNGIFVCLFSVLDYKVSLLGSAGYFRATLCSGFFEQRYNVGILAIEGIVESTVVVQIDSIEIQTLFAIVS
jgi:hypothetical protein